MKLRFVTSNPGKFREAKALLAPFGIEVVRSSQATVEVQSDRLDEIAADKANQLRRKVRGPYFLEDAGLFVESLGGFPGPFSAYAFKTLGCDGLLRLLEGRRADGRHARFEAVVAYMDSRKVLQVFRGRVRGEITRSPRGHNGFGFDPVFRPNGGRNTFAELPPEQKNRISHRRRALLGLARFLQGRELPKKRVKGVHRVR